MFPLLDKLIVAVNSGKEVATPKNSAPPKVEPNP